MVEEWKDVKGYEGLYKVSNLGNVMRCDRKTHRILKPCKSHREKYLNVHLCKNKVVKKFIIHRLVAEAFVPNPHNKRYVEHIDGNTLNNVSSNLKWVSRVCVSRNDEIEKLKDELETLRMQYLSQVSLWKSKYQELKNNVYKPIDEEKLYELAWINAETMNIPCCYKDTAIEAFRAGYRKAKEEQN